MQAGLEVQTLQRWHFGTTYYVIAKPCKTASLPA